MVQDVNGVEKDLTEWFKDTVNEYMDFEKKWLFQQIRYAYETHGPEVEKQIFKYLVAYVMARVNPPSSIEGMEINYPKWKPLSKDWIREKGHRRAYYYLGHLMNYIVNKDAFRWYGRPKVRGNYKDGILTYYSMFSYERKPFGANDGDSPFENKIKYNEYDENGNPIRELFAPMEDFLLYKKLDAVIEKTLKKVMEEEDYEKYRKFVPTTSQF